MLSRDAIAQRRARPLPVERRGHAASCIAHGMFSSLDLPVSWLPEKPGRGHRFLRALRNGCPATASYDVLTRKLSRHREGAGCRGIFCERTRAALGAEVRAINRENGFSG